MVWRNIGPEVVAEKTFGIWSQTNPSYKKHTVSSLSHVDFGVADYAATWHYRGVVGSLLWKNKKKKKKKERSEKREKQREKKEKRKRKNKRESKREKEQTKEKKKERKK